MTLKEVLINQMYEGKTIKEAVEFCEQCYCETPTEKMINAVKKVAAMAGKVWE